MQDRPKAWFMGMLGMCAVAVLSGVLLAQGQNPDPQGPNGAGGREGNVGDREAQVMIAHGLAMAIEGSTLQGIAMQSAGGNFGAVGNVGPAVPGAVGNAGA